MARLAGTLFLSGTRTLYVGPLVATDRHAHHAAQVIVAPAGLAVEDGGGERLVVEAAIIPPRAVHAHGACDHAALLFIDGDDVLSRALEHASRSAAWSRALGVAVPREPTAAEARTLITAIVDAVTRCAPPARHPAARRMAEYLDGGVRGALGELSREAGLSPRQMRHAFRRDIGLPMRAYLRWKRLRRAIAAVEEGRSLTAAAAEAGFADSAHLSRVFRAQFGLTPSQAFGAVRWQLLD